MALLCMALADLGVDAVSLHRQPGRHHHRHRPHQGQDPRGAGRPGPRRAGRRARCCVVAGFQGVSTEQGDHHPRPGRLRHHRRRPGRAPSRPTCCEIYTDVTGVFTRRPPLVPQARKLNRVSFDEMLEMAASRRPGPGAALGRVRPQPRRRPPRPLQLHLGAGHLGHRGGADDGGPDHLRRHPRRRRRPRSRSPACPTGPASRRALFEPLADADVNVDMIVQNTSKDGHDRHLLHRAQGRHGRGRGDRAATWPREIGAGGVSHDADIAKVSARRRRHEDQPRHRRQDVPRRWPTTGINIEMISTSTIRITCVVRGRRHGARPCRSLHTAFGLDSGRPTPPRCPSAASGRSRTSRASETRPGRVGRPPVA